MDDKIQENNAAGREKAPFNCIPKRGKADNSIWFFNKWNPTELTEQVHSRRPSLNDSLHISPLLPTCQHRYHQVQTRSSKERQPAKSWIRWKWSLLYILPRQKRLITSLLCYASPTYEIRRKPIKAAWKQRDGVGIFLPCSEKSKLVMEMVVPSQRFIVLQAEQ